MKTPDEIKKALECCFYDSAQCADCPYYPISCDRELVRDAREYIRQLEADKQQLEGLLTHINQLRDAAAGRALKMEERVRQLEAERDAAVKDIELCDACEVCKHLEVDGEDLPCGHCFHIDRGRDSYFEWRGVQKEE